MNNDKLKSLITVVIFLVLFAGIIIGMQLKNLNLNTINFGLLLVNVVLLLVVFGILLEVKAGNIIKNINNKKTNKKKGDANV